MWAPDVYEGAPTAVVLFIGGAPKIAALALAIRILVDAVPSLHGQWQQIFIVVDILSMALGNIGAIVQSKYKTYACLFHLSLTWDICHSDY